MLPGDLTRMAEMSKVRMSVFINKMILELPSRRTERVRNLFAKKITSFSMSSLLRKS
jgi:hypothetical protein